MNPSLVLLSPLLSLIVGSTSAPDPPAPPPHVVVVELFTSQGCSSCPPADRLLSQLPAGSSSRVVPLSFHVDYWNHAGWTDPFSSREWSERQAAYERALGLQDVYTPQAVVDGAAELVGSDADKLRKTIAAAEAKPAAAVTLRLETAGSKVSVDAGVEMPEALKSGKWDLMVALYETGLVTPVGRGENGGKTLQNDYVVRALVRAGRVKESSRLKASLPIPADWAARKLGVAAFLQDPRSLEIRGANALPLPPPADRTAAGGS